MAEDKDVTKSSSKKHRDHEHEPPVRVGDKFICPKCQAEVPMRQDCPTCKAVIDWSKI